MWGMGGGGWDGEEYAAGNPHFPRSISHCLSHIPAK